MKVKTLIRELQKLDPNSRVFVQQADFDAPWRPMKKIEKNDIMDEEDMHRYVAIGATLLTR